MTYANNSDCWDHYAAGKKLELTLEGDSGKCTRIIKVIGEKDSSIHAGLLAYLKNDNEIIVDPNELKTFDQYSSVDFTKALKIKDKLTVEELRFLLDVVEDYVRAYFNYLAEYINKQPDCHSAAIYSRRFEDDKASCTYYIGKDITVEATAVRGCTDKCYRISIAPENMFEANLFPREREKAAAQLTADIIRKIHGCLHIKSLAKSTLVEKLEDIAKERLELENKYNESLDNKIKENRKADLPF